MSHPVVISRIGPNVLSVRLNRPERRNAINAAVATAMDAAVKLAESDHSIGAVVLSAAGDKSFCAGADLAEVAAGRGDSLLTPDGGFAGFVQAKRSKPWIAAVDAPALGGGTEICLSCEIVIASARALFGLPEVRRGLFAGAGGVFRVARRIPASIAYEMISTGEHITSDRAFELGLVNRIVPEGEAQSAALQLAEQIAGNAPLGVQRGLAIAKLAQDLDEPELFRLARESAMVIRSSDNAKEGARAFLEKRAPAWTGK